MKRKTRKDWRRRLPPAGRNDKKMKIEFNRKLRRKKELIQNTEYRKHNPIYEINDYRLYAKKTKRRWSEEEELNF